MEQSLLRIRLCGLPRHLPLGRVQSICAEALQLPAASVQARKASGRPVAFLAVRTAELAMAEALSRLNAFRMADGSVLRAEEDTWAGPRLKQPSPTRSILDQVTPLWRLSYREQLEQKETEFRRLLGELSEKLRPKHERGPSESDGPVALETRLAPILPSPLVDGYRNKAEFTFGLARETHAPTLGLCLGGFLDGCHAVDSPADCLHLPAAFKALVEHVQQHLDGPCSTSLPFNVISKGGFWRILLVRQHGPRRQLMVGLQVNTREKAGLAPAVFDQLLSAFAEHLRAFEHDGIKIASYHLQVSDVGHSGLDMREGHGFERVFGEECLEEQLDGLSFKISPLSFFQNNLPATELLYGTVRDCLGLAGGSAETGGGGPVLLDLCCGTGTIGMTMAKAVDRVVGVELVAEAVADARQNASANAVSNIEFLCERVETAIGRILDRDLPPRKQLVVVLDPPRAGTHQSVIKAIRGCPRIERLVFVACDARAALQNLIDLMASPSPPVPVDPANAEEGKKGGKRPAEMPGRAFSLTRAIPVDLFPHTPHCELVLQFDRSAS